jgi:hypothetical protein
MLAILQRRTRFAAHPWFDSARQQTRVAIPQFLRQRAGKGRSGIHKTDDADAFRLTLPPARGVNHPYALSDGDSLPHECVLTQRVSHKCNGRKTLVSVKIFPGDVAIFVADASAVDFSCHSPARLAFELACPSRS